MDFQSAMETFAEAWVAANAGAAQVCVVNMVLYAILGLEIFTDRKSPVDENGNTPHMKIRRFQLRKSINHRIDRIDFSIIFDHRCVLFK